VSANRDELSVRKDLLIAQSALYRAQLRYEVMTLRSRVSRGSSWIGRGVTVLSLVRTALSVVSLFRK
jgi:hypothetical protein